MRVGLQSITLENFQSIRKAVEIPLSPATLLYGPNSAGKSAVLDGFSLLHRLLKGTGEDLVDMIRRWSHKESKSSKQLPLRIGFKAVTRAMVHPAASTVMVLHELPDYFTSDEDSLIYEDNSKNIFIEFKAKWEHHTESPEILISIDGKNVLHISPEDDCGYHEIKIKTWPFGTAFGDFLEEYGYHNQDSDTFTLSNMLSTQTDEGIDIFPGFSDKEHLTFNNTLRWISKYLLKLSAESLHYPEIIDATRGAIRNYSLTFFSNLINNSNQPPHTFSTHTPKWISASVASSDLPLISKIGRSYFKEYHDHHYGEHKAGKKAEDSSNPVNPIERDPILGEVKEAVIDAVACFFNPHDGISPKSSTEPLHQFINRSLREHLFIDQGYSVVFDVCEVLPDRKSKAGKEFWLERGAVGGFKGSPCAWMTCSLQDNAGRKVSFEDVGTGISCVLPVLAGLHSGFSFSQQPELHLHPALQSALGDVVIEAANRENSIHILETHSEYLLLRLLKRIRQTCTGKQPKGSPLRLTPDQVSVLYFNPQSDGSTEVKRIRISDEGEFLDRWPRGFFEERSKDLFDE